MIVTPVNAALYCLLATSHLPKEAAELLVTMLNDAPALAVELSELLGALGEKYPSVCGLRVSSSGSSFDPTHCRVLCCSTQLLCAEVSAPPRYTAILHLVMFEVLTNAAQDSLQCSTKIFHRSLRQLLGGNS